MLLVNNSGFGSYGRFPSNGLNRQLDMIEVNIAAPLHLVGILLPELRKRKGGIINVSSLAAFQPMPYMATYGATKSFLLEWSLALGQELKGEGVRVLALCPGPTSSNFYKSAGFSTPPTSGSLTGSGTAGEVAECALASYAKGRKICVPGWRNKFLRTADAFLSKGMQAAASEFVLRKLRLESFLKHP
jgi:uncharacterized protein